MSTWIDAWGKEWHQVTSIRRLKFSIPCHAAIRKHIFFIDNYTCKNCEAHGVDVPENYDGKQTLFTNTFLKSGYKDMLIVDHVLTLKAGGRNHISNMQTLCETCNKKKMKKDVQDIAQYRELNK